MNAPTNIKPHIMEIIGLAGAGKTTLCEVLKTNPDKIVYIKFPKVRKIKDAPFFVWYGLLLVPTLLRLYNHTSRRLTEREFAWMVVLNSWPFILKKVMKKTAKVIVLDQGPIYLLAELRESGPEFLKSKQAEKLWREIYFRWATTLDLLVWLDAPDTILMERIRTRDHEHIVKNEPDSKVFEFFAHFRRDYDLIVGRLEAISPGFRIQRFDTCELKASEIADRLFADFSHQ
jgi:thymidylate kinase